jgi:hypothetical protein
MKINVSLFHSTLYCRDNQASTGKSDYDGAKRIMREEELFFFCSKILKIVLSFTSWLLAS